MKNKNLVIGLVVVVAIIGMILIGRSFISKKPGKKATPLARAAKGIAPVPAKKAISKDRGALTVKILDSKKKDLALRIRAFKSIDGRSSAYVASFISNRMQELLPGSYDIEIATTPERIYKNVKVVKGEENIENLGPITGSINVTALNAVGKNASYSVKILHSQSNDIAVTITTNRPVEILPGVYDVEVGTLPRQVKKDVKIEAGKEARLDFGRATGSIMVKAIDENKKEVRYGVRITKSANDEFVATTPTNRPIELLKDIYNIEVSATPKQGKKDVRVNVGEETVVEFLVQAPQLPPPPTKAKK